MNSKLLLAIIAILVLSAGVYFATSKRNTSITSNEEIMVEEVAEGMESGYANTLRNLLTSGVAQTCTFTSTDDDYPGGGTVYVSGGNMRGEFQTTYEGEVKSSHMIIAYEMAYVWTDDENRGFKMAFGEEELDMAEDYSDNFSKSGFDFNENIDFSCTPGTVDSSRFTIPSEVNFVDLSRMMRETNTDNSSQCAACNNLDGEAKNQCLVALNCS